MLSPVTEKPKYLARPGTNPGPLTYESSALPTALHGPALQCIIKVPMVSKSDATLSASTYIFVRLSVWEETDMKI